MSEPDDNDMDNLSILEIVELDNGDVVIQREDGEGEPFMTIQFSDESRDYLGEQKIEIAKAMFDAAINKTIELGELTSDEMLSDDVSSDDDLSEDRVLH